MSMETEVSHSSEDGVVCPKCLLANPPRQAFCMDCGAPIGMVANVDPIQQIYAEGFAYRAAVDGPPSRIVLAGMWLIFAPFGFAAANVVYDGSTAGDLLRTAFFTLLALGSAVILFRATRNYVVKSRAATGVEGRD